MLTEIFRRVPAELSRHELEFVALRYFEQLGHDSQHRIFKFFAWEETKPKANGGYVDYPKLASGKLEKMTTAEIGKFLIVCALASDLYCPTYVGGGMLTKDSNLAREAAHYKVNAERILRELKEKPASKTGNNSLTHAMRTTSYVRRQRAGPAPKFRSIIPAISSRSRRNGWPGFEFPHPALLMTGSAGARLS